MPDSMLLKAALSFLPHKFINIQSQKRFVYSLYSFDFRFASIPAALNCISMYTTCYNYINGAQIERTFAPDKLHWMVYYMVGSNTWNGSHIVVWSPLITPNFCPWSNVCSDNWRKCYYCSVTNKLHVSYSRPHGCIYHPKYSLLLCWPMAMTILGEKRYVYGRSYDQTKNHWFALKYWAHLK